MPSAKVRKVITLADGAKKLSAQMSSTTATAVHEHVEDMLTLAYVADGVCLFGSSIDASETALRRKEF